MLKLRIARFSVLQVAVHLTAWILAAWLLWDYLSGNLTVNPIQAAQQRSGRYAIYFLVASLACTPLHTVFHFTQALSVRRALGLYAYGFAAAHFFLFVGVDYGFQFKLIFQDVAVKKYILAGATSFLILSFLALTSFKWWKKKLGKNWKRLHRLVYVASISAVLHYAWVKKGDLFSLQGDILAPMLIGLLVLLLLALRLPPVRRAVVQLRGRLGMKRKTSPPPLSRQEKVG